MRSITFQNRDRDLAGNLHLPRGFDPAGQYPALVCIHPGSSVKEQTAGIYAERLAASGFVALAFDASYQGESGGEPRYLEEPATRVEDIRCAVDFLVTQEFVDEDRIGVLGVCAGGGYAVNAAMTERRISAVGVVSPINIGRARRDGGGSPAGVLRLLQEVGRLRTAEARSEQPTIRQWIPDTPQQAVQAAFHLVEQLLTQPLQVIVGDRVGSFGSYRDGYELFRRAPGAKDLLVLEGASHYDLYDIPQYVQPAVDTLAAFFAEHLVAKRPPPVAGVSLSCRAVGPTKGQKH